MLDYGQAVYFLENVLQVSSDWRDLLQNSPLEFLGVYMKRHAIHVPFQNLEMATVPQNRRWFPTEADIVETGLSGKGGCCIHLNYFTKLIFEAIGLDSFVVRADHYGAPLPGSHCLVVVKINNGKDKGLYLVEVGGGFPMLTPIPLDKHKLPFRTLQAGGFPYEFREIADGWFGKFHLKGGLMGGAFMDRDEVLRTYWDLKPRQFWEFDYPMFETFTNPQLSSLLKQPLMCRFFTNSEFEILFPKLLQTGMNDDNNNDMINDGIVKKKTRASWEKFSLSKGGRDDGEDTENFVVVWKKRLVIGSATSRKITRNYQSYQDMSEDLKTYFPKIPAIAVDAALEVFSGYTVVPSVFDKLI